MDVLRLEEHSSVPLSTSPAWDLGGALPAQDGAHSSGAVLQEQPFTLAAFQPFQWQMLL